MTEATCGGARNDVVAGVRENAIPAGGAFI